MLREQLLISWTPADSITDINIANPFVFPSNTTEYIVTGTNALGCADADSIIVTVNPLPFVDAGVDTSICFGDSVQLNGSSAVGTTLGHLVTDLSDPIHIKSICLSYCHN